MKYLQAAVFLLQVNITYIPSHTVYRRVDSAVSSVLPVLHTASYFFVPPGWASDLWYYPIVGGFQWTRDTANEPRETPPYRPGGRPPMTLYP